MAAGLGSDALRLHRANETYLVIDNLASVSVQSIFSTGFCGEMTLNTFDRFTSKFWPHSPREVEKWQKLCPMEGFYVSCYTSSTSATHCPPPQPHLDRMPEPLFIHILSFCSRH
jgi:hypothetical protein